ncbi:MAG: FG-GAP repeat protein [Planctomycetes bacterium]|nr:FG-GAP repeat protein [Planctomycetota bacterium]
MEGRSVTFVRVGALLITSYIYWTYGSMAGAVEPCPPLYVYDGEADHEYMGISVAGAGDIDGDGCDDFLVGASGYKIPDTDVHGIVYLFSGATGEVLKYWHGEGGAFALYIAGAGDVDADETPDVIIAARSTKTDAGYQAGRVYVYSGATGDLIWSWDGDREKGQFGTGVAGAGDVNGDGHADVAVGQPGYGDEEEFPGMVYIYSGQTGELLWSREGTAASERFGESLGGGGDFNGDGCPDVVVSAHWHVPGRAYVLSGDDGRVLWAYEHYLQLPEPAGFGLPVAWVGDLNADGCDEIVVGAHLTAGPIPGTYPGAALVFAGPHGDPLWTWYGEQNSDYFGSAAAGAGDVNGDGVPDVIVGAYAYSGSGFWMGGKAYVYSGATGNLLWAADGEAGMAIFGCDVAKAGDVNADGFSDVLVGAWWHRGPAGAEAGRAYLFTPVVHADCDCDQYVGMTDYALFVECVGGSGTRWTLNGCACADLDTDGDVDLSDFALFQATYGRAP